MSHTMTVTKALLEIGQNVITFSSIAYRTICAKEYLLCYKSLISKMVSQEIVVYENETSKCMQLYNVFTLTKCVCGPLGIFDLKHGNSIA